VLGPYLFLKCATECKSCDDNTRQRIFDVVAFLAGDRRCHAFRCEAVTLEGTMTRNCRKNGISGRVDDGSATRPRSRPDGSDVAAPGKTRGHTHTRGRRNDSGVHGTLPVCRRCSPRLRLRTKSIRRRGRSRPRAHVREWIIQNVVRATNNYSPPGLINWLRAAARNWIQNNRSNSRVYIYICMRDGQTTVRDVIRLYVCFLFYFPSGVSVTRTRRVPRTSFKTVWRHGMFRTNEKRHDKNKNAGLLL